MNFVSQLLLYVFPKTRFRSEDAHIEIVDKIENGRPVRLLLYDGVRESGMYIDGRGDVDPLFAYMRTLKLMTEHIPGLNNALLLGGCGFVYPRIYLKNHPERHMTVVEIYGGYVELAKQYFGLDMNDSRLSVKIQDGYSYIQQNAGTYQYDLVIFDAYNGQKAAANLLSESTHKAVYTMLKPGGVYALNLINSANGVIAMETHLANEILKNVFRYTRIVPCIGGGNCILMASDRKL